MEAVVGVFVDLVVVSQSCYFRLASNIRRVEHVGFEESGALGFVHVAKCFSPIHPSLSFLQLHARARVGLDLSVFVITGLPPTLLMGVGHANWLEDFIDSAIFFAHGELTLHAEFIEQAISVVGRLAANQAFYLARVQLAGDVSWTDLHRLQA